MNEDVQRKINDKRNKQNAYYSATEEVKETTKKRRYIYKEDDIYNPIIIKNRNDSHTESKKDSGILDILVPALVILLIGSVVKDKALTQIGGTSQKKDNSQENEDYSTSPQIEKMRNSFKEELGKTDGTKYADGRIEDWCADLITWIKNQAGVSDDIIPNFSSCYWGAKFFKDQGTWHDRGDYIAKEGDLVFFSWSTSTISYDHVGWVDKVYKDGDDIKIKVYNGNTPKVAYSTYSINDTRIIGFASPKYSKDISLIIPIETKKLKGELTLGFTKDEYKYKYKNLQNEREI